MQWERRKPLWPILAALGLLLMMAMAAPRYWQSVPSRQAPSMKQSPVDLPAEPVVSASAVITLPPAAAEQAEALPVRREFDIDTLLGVRDKLLAMLDQLPTPQHQPTLPAERQEPEPKTESAGFTPRQAPQVQVTSENDRLAMAPRRRPRRQLPAIPVPSLETTRQEAADFAAILLEASRRPKPMKRAPRLAMLPAVPKTREVASVEIAPVKVAPVKNVPIELAPIEVALPAKTQAKKMPAVVLPPVEPAPLQHQPLALIKQLEDFSARSPSAVWSQQVLAQLRHLTDEHSGERPEVTEILNQLELLYAAGKRQTKDLKNPSYNIQWQQATQALGRRLVLWQVLLDPQQPRLIKDSDTSTALLPALSEVARLLNTEKGSSNWREYLLLDRIVESTSQSLSKPTLTRAKLAQEVLSRMADPELSEAQRKFLATPQLVTLHHALRPWAAGRVDLETLATIVERYELGRGTRYAAVIAQLQQRLQWSDDPQLQALASHLDQHYRGANMRIAMSDHLLNRMMPKQKPTVSSVNDKVAGAKVRGSARTTTQLRVRLMPDPNAWHFGLEATGKIYSDTRSDTWPARIRNAAKMQYQGRKEISIDAKGLHVTPAQASAQGRNELIGVDSQLDPIPVVGYMLRNMARKKHKKSRPTALRQAKSKVVRQVKERMDATLNQKLEGFEQKFRDKVLAPIEELALLAEPLDMHTTKQRAVMQLRLANPGQLAAHTLRPLAPSDSVLSLQMHETAMNNAMTGLGLNGRRMTMLELFDDLSLRFGQGNETPPEDLPRHAVIKFAKRDALRVRCDGDRLELVLSVAELAHRRDKIKNFQIHVHFRPVVRGLSVKLVRDGTLQFSGRRLKTGPRVVLHSVMGKLLVKDQQINLVHAKLMLDPRFAGLMVTQLVLEDGWIGLALGPASPRRTAWRASTPEVLETPFVR